MTFVLSDADRKPIFTAARDAGAKWNNANIPAMNDAINRAVALAVLHTVNPGLASVVDAVSVAAGAVPKAEEPEAKQIGLSLADFQSAAARLSCTVPQIRAVDEVESGGGWFEDVRADILNLDGPGGFIDGPNLPKILFEAHIFDKQTDGRFRSSHPNLSSKNWNRALYVGGQAEWSRLHRAMQLDAEAALMSASVGRYQIMGFNHRNAGFATVRAFWDAMMTTERAHLEAFVTYVINANLADELRQVSDNPENCRAFARGYNGTGYAANQYDQKIARAHRKFRLQA